MTRLLENLGRHSWKIPPCCYRGAGSSDGRPGAFTVPWERLDLRVSRWIQTFISYQQWARCKDYFKKRRMFMSLFTYMKAYRKHQSLPGATDDDFICVWVNTTRNFPCFYGNMKAAYSSKSGRCQCATFKEALATSCGLSFWIYKYNTDKITVSLRSSIFTEALNELLFCI